MGQTIDIMNAKHKKLSELYDWVTTNNPDLTGAELERFGYLPLIKAGIMSVDTSGLLQWGTDASAQKLVVDTLTETYTDKIRIAGIADMRPTVQGYSNWENSITKAIYCCPRVQQVTATFNAGGTLDADIDLTPAAVTGFFYVIKLKGIYTTDGGATSVTLVIQDASGGIHTFTLSLTDNFIVNTDIAEILIYGAHDTEKIFLDTTTSGPANDTIVMQIEYWLET